MGRSRDNKYGKINEKKDRRKDHGSWRQQMISYPLNIKRSEWENLDEEEQIKFRHDIINYFRKYGFPHFKYDIEEQHKELGRLDKFVSNNEI